MVYQMRATPIHLQPTENHTISVVGEGMMMLDGVYDPNQLWFEFANRAVFRALKPPEPRSNRGLPKQTQFVEIDEKFRHLYPHNAGPQYVLPFAEGRRISNKAFKLLGSINWPTWDRTSDGELLTLRLYTKESREEIVEWCMGSLKGRFHILRNDRVTFEFLVDYLVAKMRFQ